MRVKIGLVGLGHLGKVHLKCIQSVENLDLVGIYDIDTSRAQQFSKETGLKAYESYSSLLKDVAAIDIVTPTPTHFALASAAMKLGKHVFIEKPITKEVEEAQALENLQKKNKVIVQVGHVERYNPAMLAIKHLDLNPRFIEVHRLANFNPRGTDVSVVLDLMIHDLDIILSMVPSKVKSVLATGVKLVSSTADIGNARIEWENGCVANVTASRMSLKNMRKMRLFQSNAYIALDFLERGAQIIRLTDEPVDPDSNDLNSFELETATGKKTVQIEIPETQAVNAIELELTKFAHAIIHNTKPDVGVEEATAALILAHRISTLIDENELSNRDVVT